jgi:hypothetical protein
MSLPPDPPPKSSNQETDDLAEISARRGCDYSEEEAASFSANLFDIAAGFPFCTVAGREVALGEALRYLKLDLLGDPRPPVEWVNVIAEKVAMEQAAEELGLTIEAAQLQAAMNQYRRARSLYSTADTEKHLSQYGCTVDDFADAMERWCIEQTLRQRFSVAPAEQHFRQHVTEYDCAVLSELVVSDENLARELALQIAEEGADFNELVLKFSTAPSRTVLGLLGEVRRDAMRAPEAAAIFSAGSGEVVGPFPLNRSFRLLRVHETRRGQLTDSILAEIAQRLWHDWLARRMKASSPEFTILQYL